MMFVALALPALIGAVGYGTDMAQLYMWKRELQHSVDQAALAGAYALADDPSSTNYTTRAQQEFNANQQQTTAYATDPTIALADYDGGNNNSVVVSASVTRRLPFSALLTGEALQVSARAQASFAKGATYKACLMTLKDHGAGTFTVGGSATVHAACGLGALSCDDNAIKIDVTTVETDSIATCGTAQVPTELQDKVTNHASLSSPFEGLDAPLPTNDTGKTFSCPKNGTANLTPDRYIGGITAKCAIAFASGVYVIDGGTLDLSNNNAVVTGTKVMFVLKNGATLNLTGQGNKGSINLSPMEAGDFVGTVNEAHKDLYGGMLIYEDKTGETSTVAHKIAGNSTESVRGTIYLPNGDVTITGNSSTTPLCFQIWSNTLTITGNATVSTTCTSSETVDAGSTAGGVKLVA